MKTKLMSKTSLSGLLLTALTAFVLVACGGGNGAPGEPLGCSGGGTSTSGSSSGSTTGTATTTNCSSGSSGSGSTSGTSTTGVVGSVNFVSSVPSNASIVFQNTGGSGRTSVAILTFKVVDTQGNPLPGVAVSFSNNNTGLGTLSPSSGTTATDGTVIATVTAVGPTGSPAVVPPAGTLAITATAKTSGGTVSAISNLVIVSTGTPAARSFTIAPSVSNIEGFDFSGTTTTIMVLLTDVNGNPVVDGTAVAATTNEGAIGTTNSSNPGCYTVNGICDFVFTSQNPRWITSAGPTYSDIGIATVSFSATDGSGPITGSVQITQSGSWPSIFAQTGVSTWGFITGAAEPSPLITPSLPIPEIVASANTYSCNNVLFLLTDEVGNPIAQGTTLAAATSTSGYSVSSVTPTPIGNTPLNDSIVNFTIPVAASSISGIQYLNTLNPTNGSALYNPAINGTLVQINFTGSCPTSSAPVSFSLTTKSAKGNTVALGFVYYTQ